MCVMCCVASIFDTEYVTDTSMKNETSEDMLCWVEQSLVNYRGAGLADCH